MKSIKQRIRQMSVGGLLVWGVLVLSPVQVQALQAIQNSEKCKGGVPDGSLPLREQTRAVGRVYPQWRLYVLHQKRPRR